MPKVRGQCGSYCFGFEPKERSPKPARAAGSTLEPFLCKRPARRRLQVFFECKSLLFVTKGDVSFDNPRGIFRCVRNFFRVVFGKTLAGVVCDTRIKALGKTVASQNIDEFHRNFARPPTSLCDFGAAAFALLPPARRAVARRAKAGGAKRDRTADLLHAMQALSQLSYGPIIADPERHLRVW